MKRIYNTILICTGKAGYNVAYRLEKARKKTAVID